MAGLNKQKSSLTASATLAGQSDPVHKKPTINKGYEQAYVHKQLFVIYHCPSANTVSMLNALLKGAAQVSGIDVHAIKALECKPEDLQHADAIVILTTENLGYMAGGTKDWFDRIYYPLQEQKQGLPYCCVIRAGSDGTGTQRAIQSICQGLKWRPTQASLICKGEWQPGFADQCKDLGQLMGECLNMGII